jgi:hypothetical protein
MGQCEKYNERGDMATRRGEDRERVGRWQASMGGSPQTVQCSWSVSNAWRSLSRLDVSLAR